MPFFVGCHSVAISENWLANELVIEGFLPAQYGQPCPARVLLWRSACHSWSGPLEHFHHTFACEPETILSGVNSLFFVGCHSAAIFENWLASELVMEGFLPVQYGQRDFLILVLSPIIASHSWSGPLSHFHQTFLLEPATTLSGVNLPFFAGCHSAAVSGNRLANELVTEGYLPAQ